MTKYKWDTPLMRTAWRSPKSNPRGPYRDVTLLAFQMVGAIRLTGNVTIDAREVDLDDEEAERRFRSWIDRSVRTSILPYRQKQAIIVWTLDRDARRETRIVYWTTES